MLASMPRLSVRSDTKKLQQSSLLLFCGKCLPISFLPSFLSVEDQGYFCQNYNNGGTIASHDVWLFITPFVWKNLGQN